MGCLRGVGRTVAVGPLAPLRKQAHAVRGDSNSNPGRCVERAQVVLACAQYWRAGWLRII